MKTKLAISHDDLIKACNAQPGKPLVDLIDDFAEWFDGADFKCIIANEQDSYNFKTLPEIVKKLILEKVDSKELPESFVILYFD